MDKTVWADENSLALLEERYELAVSRIREIARDGAETEGFSDFFACTARFLLLLDDVKEKLESGRLDADPEEAAACNRKMYEDILPENYGQSYANPAYAAARLGEERGKLMCFLGAQLRGIIAYLFEGKEEAADAHLELFLQIFRLASHPEELPEGGDPDTAMNTAIRDALYWFESDYTDVLLEQRTREMIDPACNFAMDILMNADLEDLNYLYRYGEYITDSERMTARFLNTLSEEEIALLADTWTEGYRTGFVLARKPLEKKRTVHLIWHAGFERIVRRAVLNFEKMGLKATVRRTPVSAMAIRGSERNEFTGASPNPQYDYDHREDAALMLDTAFSGRKVQAVRSAYEKYRSLAAEHAGPAVMETFGEAPFEPANTKEAWRFTARQQALSTKMQGTLSQIANTYIIGEERSFTIIAMPLPDIACVSEAEKDREGVVRTTEGKWIDTVRYEEIFRAIMRINTLDAQRYTKIQSILIDALDKGTHVHIAGQNGNRTDLTVRLCSLKDPEHETKFENCGSDVNIPAGEVFTSPVLKGTDGILHVSRVYLKGLNFRDLQIRFADGMTAEVSCANFEDPAENERYIRENILYHHPSLPMGEFAIGTNTTAYAAADQFGIAAELPILIAEKMGPHFAVGDTCYSWDEELDTFNPDGKRIVARDNEVSILRKTDPSKAYFGCHTDITIPYEELGLIEVLGEDGYRAELLREGRFVLPGTEELNAPLDEI